MKQKGYALVVGLTLLALSTGMAGLMIGTAHFNAERRSMRTKIAAQAQLISTFDRAVFEWAKNKLANDSDWSAGSSATVTINDLQDKNLLPEGFASSGTPLGVNLVGHAKKIDSETVVTAVQQTGSYSDGAFGFFDPSPQARRAIQSRLGRQYRQNYAGTPSLPVAIDAQGDAEVVLRPPNRQLGQRSSGERPPAVPMDDIVSGTSQRRFGTVRNIGEQASAKNVEDFVTESTALRQTTQQFKQGLGVNIEVPKDDFNTLNSDLDIYKDRLEATKNEVQAIRDILDSYDQDAPEYDNLRSRLEELEGTINDLESNTARFDDNLQSLDPES